MGSTVTGCRDLHLFGLGGFTEVIEKASDPPGGAFVPFDFTRPLAFTGVAGQLPFTLESRDLIAAVVEAITGDDPPAATTGGAA